jgi:hypothetical protein
MSFYDDSDPRFLSGLPVRAAVIESKVFVRAGEALGMTQSGVSRAIQRLEERLGFRNCFHHWKLVVVTQLLTFVPAQQAGW